MGKKLVVFGGEHEFNKVEKNRVCLHDVKILNVETMEWSSIQTKGIVMEKRRYHVCASIGKHILVHGGLNN